MTEKTQIEAKHYDAKVSEALDRGGIGDGILRGNDRLLRKAHEMYINLALKEISLRESSEVLDYGCGTGQKHLSLISSNTRLTGIDISETSVRVASAIASEKGLNANYLVMDAENLQFPADHFDVVLDCDSFSSLDMDKAFPALLQVMKPSASLICIETYGHNPFTNFRRRISVLTGRRTRWAAAHILKKKDWRKMQTSFAYSEIHYFGFFVLFAAPLANILPSFLLATAEAMDRLLFKISIFRNLAFKTVVLLKHPKKNNETSF